MRIGLIGDIHEDVVALKQAFRFLEIVRCDQVICLGDIVGYKVNAYNYLDTRNAHECIAMIRSNCQLVVIGNNDLFQIKKVPSYSGGFDFPLHWYELDYFERKRLSQDSVFLYEDVELAALMTKEDAAWLNSLPAFAISSVDGFTIMYSHFCYPDLHGVMAYFPKMPSEFCPHLDFMQDHDCKLGFSGHMHFEGTSVCNGSSINRFDFGTIRLQDQRQWLFGPCVARGRFDNGITIFDTTAQMVHSIPLSSTTTKEKIIQWIEVGQYAQPDPIAIG
jgi:predicted phosphodiesterase